MSLGVGSVGEYETDTRRGGGPGAVTTYARPARTAARTATIAMTTAHTFLDTFFDSITGDAAFIRSPRTVTAPTWPNSTSCPGRRCDSTRRGRTPEVGEGEAGTGWSPRIVLRRASGSSRGTLPRCSS